MDVKEKFEDVVFGDYNDRRLPRYEYYWNWILTNGL